MDLNTYLHTALPTPCFERPFVCDGRPESCTVIIIGENPVTTMNKDWWSFWNDDAGFDLTSFEQTYEVSRSLIGKRPISNTRLRLRRMRSRGIRCLETNAFRNERLGGHGKGMANKELLQAFIEKLPQLRAIVAHGNIASRCLSEMVLPGAVAKYCVGHFRSLSYMSLDTLADALLDCGEET